MDNFGNGAPGGIRTPDHLVRSQVLYPTELRARCLSAIVLHSARPEGLLGPSWASALRARATRVQNRSRRFCRTPDHLVRSQVLYPTELRARCLSAIVLHSARPEGLLGPSWASALRARATRVQNRSRRFCRTPDHLVRSQVLYPTELRTRCFARVFYQVARTGCGFAPKK